MAGWNLVQPSVAKEFFSSAAAPDARPWIALEPRSPVSFASSLEVGVAQRLPSSSAVLQRHRAGSTSSSIFGMFAAAAVNLRYSAPPAAMALTSSSAVLGLSSSVADEKRLRARRRQFLHKYRRRPASPTAAWIALLHQSIRGVLLPIAAASARDSALRRLSLSAELPPAVKASPQAAPTTLRRAPPPPSTASARMWTARRRR